MLILSCLICYSPHLFTIKFGLIWRSLIANKHSHLCVECYLGGRRRCKKSGISSPGLLSLISDCEELCEGVGGGDVLGLDGRG